MPFPKMTAKDLFEKLMNVYWKSMSNLQGSYKKIGARALKLEVDGGKPLYFIWYDDDNWTIGTKMYRKKPECQIHEEPRGKHAI